ARRGLPPRLLRDLQPEQPVTRRSSPPVDGRNEQDDYAPNLDELHEQLGLQQIHLLGHSHGGFVALVYALSYPQLLARLVLVCSAARFSDELRREAEAAFAAHEHEPWFADAVDAVRRRQSWDFASREELAELYAREARLWFANPTAADPFLSELRRQRPDSDALRYFNSRLAAGYDMRSRLPEIRALTLILNGSADFFGPQVSARELCAIPGSRARIIPGAGHFPFVEAPERFRSDLETFLQL